MEHVWISSLPHNSVVRADALTTLLHRAIIELYNIYNLINFGVLDAVAKSVLQLDIISISFEGNRDILTTI